MPIMDSKTGKIIKDYTIKELINKAQEMRAYNMIALTVAGVASQGKRYHAPLLMDMVGVQDRFGESGAPWELMKVFGLTAEHIAQRAKELYGRK